MRVRFLAFDFSKIELVVGLTEQKPAVPDFPEELFGDTSHENVDIVKTNVGLLFGYVMHRLRLAIRRNHNFC